MTILLNFEDMLSSNLPYKMLINLYVLVDFTNSDKCSSPEILAKYDGIYILFSN